MEMPIEFFPDDWKFVSLQFYRRTQIVLYHLSIEEQRVVWKTELSELNSVKCQKEQMADRNSTQKGTTFAVFRVSTAAL